jgi:hypothetical protein
MVKAGISAGGVTGYWLPGVHPAAGLNATIATNSYLCTLRFIPKTTKQRSPSAVLSFEFGLRF